MLRTTERNTAMLSRIRSVFTEQKADEDLMQALKEAVTLANEDAEDFSGTKAVAWVMGGLEYAVTWTLKQGSIMEVAIRRSQPGVVRVVSEERFFC